MSDTVIRVENLSKQYRIGGDQARYGSLRESLAGAITGPLRRLGNSHNGSKDTRPQHIWALKGVSFEVKQGEVVGIIGRNGAGKSTLLKILSRITKPTEGQVRIKGRVGSLLEVGTGFHPELTGRENIYLNGAILGMQRVEIERKFDEIVNFAEIEQFLDTPVKHYSSGMYMRLAFAVAAHLEPEILLVDEVLAVGDVAFQKKCLGKMDAVAKTGRTVLFVSHNMNAISQLCKRVICVDHGKIIGDGDSAETILTYMQLQRSQYDGATLNGWNTQYRSRNFFEEIQINGIPLPAELIIPAKSTLHIRIIGDANNTFLRNFRSGIHISTQEGARIMSYGTPWSSIGDIHFTGRVKLTCTIKQLSLVPGRYLISIGCSDDSGSVDWLDNACLLTITTDAETASRLVPTYKIHGYILTESNWEFERV